jgi:serine/threonine protein kinase
MFRGIKPENIALTRKGHIRLIDFSYSKVLDEHRTFTLCGTPEYCAPEILSGTGMYVYIQIFIFKYINLYTKTHIYVYTCTHKYVQSCAPEILIGAGKTNKNNDNLEYAKCNLI